MRFPCMSKTGVTVTIDGVPFGVVGSTVITNVLDLPSRKYRAAATDRPSSFLSLDTAIVPFISIR